MANSSEDGNQLDNGFSSTPTPLSHLHRSMSQSSQPPWTSAETPLHHNQGTSYFQPGSYGSSFHPPASPSTRLHHQVPTPILVRSSSTHSVRSRRGPRSTSISSRGFRDDEPLSEEDEQLNGERSLGKRVVADVADAEDDDDDAASAMSNATEDPITLKERQSLINVEHPFGLPIWKPALYKKSRSVTRHADEALHSVPSAQAERHLLPGNIFWVVVFGWWMALVCFLVAAILHIIPTTGPRYSTLVFGLGWYLAWPFGKYVEGDVDDEDDEELLDEENEVHSTDTVREDGAGDTVRGVPLSENPTITPETRYQHIQSVSWNSIPSEETALLNNNHKTQSYGTSLLPHGSASSSSSAEIPSDKSSSWSDLLGKISFWLFFITLIAPIMLFVCLICWGLVITIPMAKLNWALIQHIWYKAERIRFCSAPNVIVVAGLEDPERGSDGAVTVEANGSVNRPRLFSVKQPRIAEGQTPPHGSGKVLLCTYRAVGTQYYKYTVGGVNILFINLLPLVFFVIFDGIVLLDIAKGYEKEGKPVPWLLSIVASQALIFLLSLLSVIPLSYFIGMAVASISAQSSIGMGAVINATFGSIIEIILYSLMLTQGKGHLVEGSIVGSLLAGVLLMPGMSMCSGALRRKEQSFNAKSAGVTSMMLIMAIIGALTPTLFYQTYGNFQLICSGCPLPSAPMTPSDKPWMCNHCYYEHPDPVSDPFYQSTVKTLMYLCAIILVFSYLIGLWFSLRTHATQIWQNPQQLLHANQPLDLPVQNQQIQNPRTSIYQRLLPRNTGLTHKASTATNLGGTSRPHTPGVSPAPVVSPGFAPTSAGAIKTSPMPRRVSYATSPQNTTAASGFSPVLESVDHGVKTAGLANMQTLQLPDSMTGTVGPMTTDEFTRAVAVATVSALRHQQQHGPRVRSVAATEADHGGHGGHDAPSWSRTTSASVLLACTALYAVIAEILVDVVDVILEGSGIDEKFLGITIFALVPNTTEFMNAISFALNGNIALSMEIGSAYALQVCLLQIPAMVGFSAWWAPEKMGEVANTFTLIFPRWDVIVIILSMFLMTYTYIEAKSNYHRGSILILSYLVLAAGFYFAPHVEETEGEGIHVHPQSMTAPGIQEFTLSGLQFARWWAGSWWR
ncbi:hypothetical protein C8J56DRAFT_8920 [Mycena floridula]|nr:hypothetical protein C8J56DRAFT_8920 [Mycena floridula]